MAVITDSVQVDAYKNKDGTREYGRCTAWVNFNGTGTVAIRDALNVSSITDNGLGNYTVNFAQSMTNVNYCVTTGSRQDADPNENAYDIRIKKGGLYTQNAVSVVHGYYTTANIYSDLHYGLVQIFGGDS